VNDPWAFGWTQLLTIIGFCITVTIALGSFRTFNRWRREKIEEKRLDVALEALSIAYEAQMSSRTFSVRLSGSTSGKTCQIRE
jgi:hypothetical protein